MGVMIVGLSCWRLTLLSRIWTLVVIHVLTAVMLALVEVGRLFVAFLALDQSITIQECATLLLGSFVGGISSVVPGGLGVREYVSSWFGTWLDVTNTEIFLAVLLNRMAGYLVVAFIFFLFLLTGLRQKGERA